MEASISLDRELRELLGARKGDWETIARESGVSYSWLSKFYNGHIGNPGYETLKALALVLKPNAEQGA